MNTELVKVAFRKNAIFIPQDWIVNDSTASLNETTIALLVNCNKLGYTFSEELLSALNGVSPKVKVELVDFLKDVTGVNKNWTPLVKQWNVPTGESIVDHLITWFANVFQLSKGTKLPCGHLIPVNTFPIERYTGCPFCGTPFEFEKLTFKSRENKLKILQLWTEADLKRDLVSLLESPVALDATQVDSLKSVMNYFGLPASVEIKMKETLMIVVDTLVEQNQEEVAGQFFKTPNDILRYLWYKHTGFLQIIEPKTIAYRLQKNAKNMHSQLDGSVEAKINSVNKLKLKFNRTECKRYAIWLNNLTLEISTQCEMMHPKRGIWVRVIRALRLAEYSKRQGFERLAKLLDMFYNQKYEVWQGKVDAHKLKSDAEGTFTLLKQRPGLFARSLFSSMLWFGPEIAIKHFKEVIDQVPSRLVFTLNMYAEVYFVKNGSRTVKPLGGISKYIPSNKLLQLYSDEELERMQMLIQELSLELIKSNFKKELNASKTMFIDEGLFNIPIAIGDRNETLQDFAGALTGTRYKIEGDMIRLFMQWGVGLPEQHLDMDLSCTVSYGDRADFCSFSQLVVSGCKHSGDIQRIPEKIGTAEYIEIDLNELVRLNAKYVSFTCNAYTNGGLAPNLVVGWMNSKSPMNISKYGVAYDPTAVQHQVRIKQSLTKGLVFGVLEIETREIVWLELSFDGQVVQDLSLLTVESILKKLDAKLKIGDLLKLKAEVQGLEIISESESADEVYDMKWVQNTTEVSKLFLK